MAIYGFTLLRNGLKYDYPYLESLRSLCAFCDEVFLALGASDDGTEKTLSEFKNLVVVPTVWDENLRKSGLILSQQTNVALAALRARHKSGWGMYLQADEVLHEKDFPLIRADAAAADKEGADAISFRYLHFWQSYHRIAIGRRWYPQEIRAVRLDSAAESSGDAQGFSSVRKRYESEAAVYHYGHVREAQAYERKKSDFHRWWHDDESLGKVLAKGEKRDAREPTLPYYGPQPSFMRDRIGASFAPSAPMDATVFGRAEEFGSLSGRVKARLRWTSSPADLFAGPAGKLVVLQPLAVWDRVLAWFRRRSSVPCRMKSPQAREWTKEFQAVLKFSEQGIYVE